MPRASSMSSGSRIQPLAYARSAKPPGRIVGSANAGQSDSWPAQAELAFAAGGVVHERDAPAVGCFRHDLVTEHGSGWGDPDLLDIGTAETAGEDANELARPLRLADVFELGSSLGA